MFESDMTQALEEVRRHKLKQAQDELADVERQQREARSTLQDLDRKVAEARGAHEQAKRDLADAIPVDRTAQQLVSGGSVPQDRAHTTLKPNGQQQDYIVLTQAERDKGFVRPYRESYTHRGKPLCAEWRNEEGDPEKFIICSMPVGHEGEHWESAFATTRVQRRDRAKALHLWGGCGEDTTMGRQIAETYARCPDFYSGTFCVTCGHHYPLDQFVWTGSNETVGS